MGLSIFTQITFVVSVNLGPDWPIGAADAAPVPGYIKGKQAISKASMPIFILFNFFISHLLGV